MIELPSVNEIPADKPLADYCITASNENYVTYSEQQPVSSLDADLLKGLYRNLPHYRGCDFTDAVFLSDDTKPFLQDLGAVFDLES